MTAPPALPETRYATAGNVNVAYQVMGEGPVDLVMVPGLVSHVEFFHELPGYTSFLRPLASFARVISFDKRGQGLSDRMVGSPTLDERMDDLHAVMEAVGTDRVALFGYSEGASMSLLFSATHPQRVSHLIVYGGTARFTNCEGYPHMWPLETMQRSVKYWGTGASIKMFAPGLAVDPEATKLWARGERLICTPGGYQAMLETNALIDVRSLLPQIQVPTLVLHSQTDQAIPVENGRYLGAKIPGAGYIEYPGGDHTPWGRENVDKLCGDIEEFMTGRRDSHQTPEVDRILATILFTDIVDSTRELAAMGDRRWRELLDQHDRAAKRLVEQHRGRLIKTTGDGILASFDGPGRGIKCAIALAQAATHLGLRVRGGLHTGEVEVRDEDVAGIAVNAAARIMAVANPSEILVSRVVTDLVAGAGVTFEPKGAQQLKGLPGTWDLYAALH